MVDVRQSGVRFAEGTGPERCMIADSNQSLSHSHHQRISSKDYVTCTNILTHALASDESHLRSATSQRPNLLDPSMEHGSVYSRNPQWFGATFATRSGLARAPIIESAGEPLFVISSSIGVPGPRCGSAGVLLQQCRSLKRQNDEILRFVSFLNERTEQDPKELIFDSQLTTYANLSRLNQQGIQLITLRRASAKMPQEAAAQPVFRLVTN